MSSTKSASSSAELLLGANNWTLFSRNFESLVREQKGSLAQFMVAGELPDSHPFNPSCVYMSTDPSAKTIGNPADVWTSLSGVNFSRIKVLSDRDISECRKYELDFKDNCIQVAGKIVNALRPELREKMGLLPDWDKWVVSGRVDHMWKKLKDTCLHDTTSVVKPSMFSFHINKVLKNLMSITQGTRTLAAYTAEMQREVDRLINAGFPILQNGTTPGNQLGIAIICFSFLQGLNIETYKEDLLTAEREATLDPTKIAWAETLALASKWQGARERTENSLRNNGNPVSSTANVNSTNVNPNNESKKKKKQKNKDKKQKDNAESNTATASNIKTCRVCGYDCGHCTGDCTLLSGAAKTKALESEANTKKFLDAKHAKKKN